MGLKGMIVEVTAVKLRLQLLPQIALNDRAHQIDHVDAVYANALNINESLGLGIPEKHIAIMAYVHDLFCHVSREDHHELGAKYLETTNEWFMEGISGYDRKLLANAVREHRASWTGGLSSVYSELLATADRGKPGNLQGMIRRAYHYGCSKLNLSPAEAYVHAHVHMHEKYGRNGYASYPAMYNSAYAGELEVQYAAIDALEIPTLEAAAKFLSENEY